ncbi:hypothetical protein GCM10027176_60940 [Actinoallomurus bryophytorum]|uniref:sulfatase n=1 Tax=Actinoallomurus bryophytorum TaxID=1490222 RepID=UPI001150AA65|nr:sulfatase [Actinoallomurus bryophytorum]
MTTALACVLVLFALIAPNQITRFTPEAFVRIPLEGLLGVALVLILPGRAKRVAAVIIGVILGLLAIVKIVDIGFSTVLARPFNLVFDWSLFGSANQFLSASVGRAGAIGAGILAAVLAVGVLVLMTLAVLRLTRLVVQHNTSATGAATLLGVAWVTCAALGAQLVPGVPVAGVAAGRLLQVRRSLEDRKEFAKEASVDAFGGVPSDRLLTGLRGKDVLLSFVESYGRDAIEDPRYASEVGAVLDAGSSRLRAAGFASRSAFLTSPTAGGGSWLAHSTLLSGLWINNQQRYNSLVSSDRLTLSKAFEGAGWQTAAVMPGTTTAWPEAKFYGYEHVYDRWTIGYRGPRFNWGTPPDQYTLSVFQRTERAKPKHPPVMAEIPLVTSHAPWAPTPSGLVDWKTVGDGTVFGPMAAAGDKPEDVWRSPSRIRTAYRQSIEYSLNALISYVQTYGDDNLVLIFLGDHQPAPLITGQNADRDVPITIVARDPAVLDRISTWGWQDGLKPGPHAPVWPMNAFRDRFLTAFGSQPQPTR